MRKLGYPGVSGNEGGKGTSQVKERHEKRLALRPICIFVQNTFIVSIYTNIVYLDFLFWLTEQGFKIKRIAPPFLDLGGETLLPEMRQNLRKKKKKKEAGKRERELCCQNFRRQSVFHSFFCTGAWRK